MLLMITAVVFLAASCGAAGQQAKPGNGGPFKDFQQSQLVFVPPSNVTHVNAAIVPMVDGLKSECKQVPSSSEIAWFTVNLPAPAMLHACS